VKYEVLHTSAYEDGTDRGSETSAIINQTPGNYPKENLLYSVHGESLNSRIHCIVSCMFRSLSWLSSGGFIAKDILVLQKLFETMHKFSTLELISKNISVFYIFNMCFKPYILNPGTLHLYNVSKTIAIYPL